MRKFYDFDQEIRNERIVQSRENLNLTAAQINIYVKSYNNLQYILPHDIALEFIWKNIFDIISPIERSLKADIAGELFMALIPEYSTKFWTSDLEKRANYTYNHPKLHIDKTFGELGEIWLHAARVTSPDDLQHIVDGLNQLVKILSVIRDNIEKISWAQGHLPNDYSQASKSILKNQKQEIQTLSKHMANVVEIRTALNL